MNPPPDAPANTTCNGHSMSNLSPQANFVTSTPMVRSTTLSPPKSIIKKGKLRTPKKACKRMRFDFAFEDMDIKGLPEGELLSTVHEELDNIRDSSFDEDFQKEHEDLIKEDEKTNNSANKEPLASSKPTDKTGTSQQEELFKISDPCLSHRTHTPGSAAQEEESTLPYGMSLSKEASRTSFNNSTKTIIIEDLTCVPDDKEKTRRCWLSLPGTNYSMTIADKFDIMYNKPVTDRVINYAQQLLKGISSQVNGLQDCCLVPVEVDGSWMYSVRMRRVLPPSCQIHHTGTDHWIASIQESENEQVVVFDSSQGPSPRLSQSLEMQLFAIYGRGKRHLQVLRPHVQQQYNGVDCGIFAIAFATEFVYKQYAGNELIEFDRPKMRDHLLECFQSQNLTPFPKMKRKMRLKNKTMSLDSTTSVISR